MGRREGAGLVLGSARRALRAQPCRLSPIAAVLILFGIAVAARAQTSPLDLYSFSDTPDPVAPGGRVGHHISFSNSGGLARDVVLTVAYDPNVSFAGASRAPDAGTTNRWTFLNVSGGSGGFVTLEVGVGAGVADGTVLRSTATATDNLGEMSAASPRATSPATHSASASGASPGATSFSPRTLAPARGSLWQARSCAPRSLGPVPMRRSRPSTPAGPTR